ncbi:MAG: tetratricopeptide repeat protein, partial [Myxococcota bacterium]
QPAEPAPVEDVEDVDDVDTSPEADEERPDEWSTDEREDVGDRPISDASEEAIWRERIEEAQASGATISIERSKTSVWTVLIVIVLLLVAGGVGAGAYAMKSLGDAHEEILAEALSQQSADTYRGYLGAVDTLEKLPDATSFAGPEVDAYLAEFGLTSNRVETSREAAATQLALLNAMIEFRYEQMDSRKSDEYIDRAEAVAGDGPEVATARAYRLMAGGDRQKARAALSEARLDYSRSRDLAAASIELELASGRARAADHAAGLLRDTSKERVYFDYLLGRIDLAKQDPAAEDVFRGILERSSPDHLSARISQSYAIRLGKPEGTKLQEARALVEPILDGLGDRASPVQKAKAHVAIGHTYMAEGALEEAGPHFEKAVELSPTRAALHIDLVEYYVVTEQPEEALEQIDTAIGEVGQTDSLSHLKARALYQLRRCEDVIDAVAEISEPSHASEFLAGRCHLETGAPGRASEAFEAAAQLDEDTPLLAKALQLVAKARLGEELDEARLPVMDSLVEKSESAPELLRAQGLFLLEFGEAETGLREQRELFERAIESLEQAAEKREGWRLVEYDLCRAHMRLGHEEKAAAHCLKGRELDPLYRPGMTTAIEFAILRGEYDAASNMAAELAKHFPDAPDVRLARVRTMVARGEVSLAEAQNERWSTGSDAQKAQAGLARGLVAFERGDYPAAARQFEAAHQVAPHRVEPAVYYAWASAMQGDEAGEDILRHRLSDPIWGARAWQALGELRLRQGRFNSARQNFAKALEQYRDTIAPGWRLSESYAGLARAWANLQGWDHYMTRRYVSRASSKADPDSLATRFLSGVYHLKKRRPDFDRATERFEYVLERKPYHCEALEYLLDIYERKDAEGELERLGKLSTKHCTET